MNLAPATTWLIVVSAVSAFVVGSTNVGTDDLVRSHEETNINNNYSHQNESDDQNLVDSGGTQKKLPSPSPSPVEEDSDGWSPWSEWSTCSRSCDGGVLVSLRKCVSKKSGCVGDDKRYRICNMQPCPNEIDFRAAQCSAHNHRPYRGRLYQWLPFFDRLDPCSLTCRAKNLNFVAKLARQVTDGTRCRPGALDMCVDGRCLPVGCDLRLGSDKRVDVCGVCGGDDSTCNPRPAFVWTEASLSPCSVSCGKGFQLSRPICVDNQTREQVDEILCDIALRPRQQIVVCNDHLCPAKWIVEPWTKCTRPCGGGRQTREAICIQDGINGTRFRVPDESCPKSKPITEKACNPQECPQWFEGPWSECSAKCGSGHQNRPVVCRDSAGNKSDDCTNETKPVERQKCVATADCRSSGKPKSDDLVSQEDSPRLPFALPWVQKLTSPSSSATSEPSFVVGDWSECSVSCGKGQRRRSVDCKIYLEFSKTIAKLPDKQCPGQKPAETETCYRKSCSLYQNGDDQNTHDDSHENKRRNDDDDDRDQDEQDTDERDDDGEENNVIGGGVDRPKKKLVPLSKIVAYSWKSVGFTRCTASCLGGVQESNIQCVREHDQSVVNPYQCDINKKPPSITKTCNDIPCPPRWNMSDFGPCNKECGGGEQIRQLQCVHEVTRGIGNTVVVPNHRCPQPPPKSKQVCNTVDCPAVWLSDPWSKCSKGCGGGIKTRKVKCVKLLAFGQKIEQPATRCSKKKPKTIRVCNSRPCPSSINEIKELAKAADKKNRAENTIHVSNGLYVQEEPRKKVILKVTGKAIVLKGTTVKLRCPRVKSHRKLNRTEWFKDDMPVDIGRKFHYIGRASFRIKKIGPADAGTYTCTWDMIKRFSIKLQVKSPTTSHEDKTVEARPDFLGRFANTNFVQPNTLPEDKEVSSKERKKPSARDFGKLKYGGEKKEKHSNKINELRTLNFDANYLAESPLTTSDPRADTWEVGYGGERQQPQTVADQENRRDQDDQEEDKETGQTQGKFFHLQQLLAKERKEKTRKTAASAESLTKQTSSRSDRTNHQFKRVNNFAKNTVVLGKGNPNQLKFNWVTTEWSECSLSCGGTGLQVRASQCFVRLENVSKTVDDSLCLDAGLESPETVRSCGVPDCPFWETGQWSKCHECVDITLAVQRREIKCIYINGSSVDPCKCNVTERPADSRQCFNENCTVGWTAGPWSDCEGRCGSDGIQSRILQCLWNNNQAPAGSLCDEKPKPEVMRACSVTNCPDTCTDKSRHCNIVKSLDACSLQHYKQQCCQTCGGR